MKKKVFGITFAVLFVTVLILGFIKFNTQERKIIKLEKKVETLTAEKDKQKSEKNALQDKLRRCSNAFDSEKFLKENMKHLLRKIQPLFWKIFHLSCEGNMCISLVPWVMSNRRDFLDFNIRIQQFAPIISIIYPEEGEILWPESRYQIKWWKDMRRPIRNVKIQYSTNNGRSWTTIIDSTPNDGSYTWATPNVAGKYIMKVNSLPAGQYIAKRKFEIR